MIYDVATKELRQVLEGCGTVSFRPRARQHQSGHEGETELGAIGERPAYTLVSNVATGERRPQPYSGLILWELDCNGKLFVEEERIDSAAMATKAIDAILPELESEHEWTRAFVDASHLHADFVKALEKTSADHRRRNYTVIPGAYVPSFGETPFSSDGDQLLYVINNGNTQHGMREPDALPQVVVYDMNAGREIHRFRGHTDSIMWIGFSPDERHVASVAWDGTLRMNSNETGELEWETADSGGQSWAGAFSSDSKHIVWSSTNGREIRVHRVADGKVISTFPETVTRWCRRLSWHPTEERIALCADRTAYVWQPFDGPGGVVVQRWVMDDDTSHPRMAQVGMVSWLADGRLLSLTTSDQTTLVYDAVTNAKEMFKRPKGVDGAHVRWTFYELPGSEEGGAFYLSIDGDGEVRYWNRSVAPLPEVQSRGGGASDLVERDSGARDVEEETKNEENVAAVRESDRYIKSAINAESDTSSDVDREAWAKQGTSIWTAE